MNMEQLEHPRHPYLLTIFGFILLGIISLIIWTRVPAQSGSSVSGWETIGKMRAYITTSPPGINVTSNTPISGPEPAPATPDISQFVTSRDGSTYLIESARPITNEPISPSKTAAAVIKTDSAFHFEDFMEQLRHAPSGPQTPAQTGNTPLVSVSNEIGKVYALLPPELLAPIQANAANRSALQEALYTYGNTAGQFIKTYELMHPHDAQMLQYFFDDRTPAHAATVKELAKDIATIGTNLKTMTNIPEKAAVAHQTLAESYITLGTRLESITHAQTDEALVKLLEPYNEALDPYISSYVELVTLFSSNGVTFKEGDGGSVFMFQALSL